MDQANSSTGLTESLSRFIANPGLDTLPAEAARIIKTGFTDTVATMIAGRDEPVVRIVREFVAARQSGAREAQVLLGAEKAASADAALINATAAHALDYDDVALGGHPSTVLVPAILAEGQRLGVSGAQALRAYLVGYEVWAELLSREPDAYHLKGWHPTAVLGTVGAAAAVAYLHRLSADKCRNAIALAASMASGLVANFGTMTKPLHAGRAASCAIDAVRLTVGGLTAAPDAIEHQAGYLAALSPLGRADRAGAASALGSELRILDTGLSIKRYPMCYATHRVIDGVLALATTHDVKPADVKEVHASVGAAQASMLRNHAPRTGLEAKFSLEFAVASALVARKVGLGELTDEFVARPQVRDVMTRLTISTTDTHCPVEPVFALTDSVVLELNDGRTLDSGEIRFARGNAKLPLDGAELKAKFLDCAAGAAELDAAALYARFDAIEVLANVRDLFFLSL
jgi:2-methylcitrate dehydratase PrpD